MITATTDSARSLQRAHDLRARTVYARVVDLSIVVLAIAGAWFFWSEYRYLSGLSWWYDSVQNLHERTAARPPDYHLGSLPWNVARSRAFEAKPDGIAMVTSDEPFAYQAYATIETGGASAVDFDFEVEVESGGVTVGLLQGGKWIAVNSSDKPGSFKGANSARLAYRRSTTVMIANDNPSGASRFTVKSLRLFLRK